MKRGILLALGGIFLLLGGIGIAVPVLPTTPFVLVASACFASGSPQLYAWLAGTSFFGEFIGNYKTKAGVRKKVKIHALLFLYSTLGISAYFAKTLQVHLLLAAVAVGVTIHILLLKTRRDPA